MALNLRNTADLTPYEFKPGDLSSKAYDWICKQSDVYYKDENGIIYESSSRKNKKAWLIGSMAEVEEYIEWSMTWEVSV